jgi:hypothetical protein
MINFFLQRSAYQFFLNVVQFLEFVQDYVTAAPQTFLVHLAGAVAYILACPAI